jgi:hypothetical protein
MYDCRDAGGRATQDAVAEEVDNAGAIIEERSDEAISNRLFINHKDCFATLAMTNC